jgi:hypothetical protein
MNPRQAGVLVLGIIILVLMGLYPPVNRVLMMKITNASGELVDEQEVTSEFQGYRSYFSLGQREDSYEFQVAKWILGAQWLLVLVMIRVLMVAFRDSKPGLPHGKLFHDPKTSD